MFCSDDRCVVQYVVEFVPIKSNEELVFIQGNGLRESAGRAIYLIAMLSRLLCFIIFKKR